MSDSDRQMVTVNVIDVWKDEMWPLEEFLRIINEGIPAERRATARVTFERGGYDETGKFEVSYERPETDAEMAARIARHAKYEADYARQERAQYEALKKKFG